MIGIEEKVQKFIQSYYPADSRNIEMFLQPLQDIHLRSDHIRFQALNHKQGSIHHIYILSVVALFIFILAYLNFINLFLALQIKRIHGTIMRKVLGATKQNISFQIFVDTLIVIYIAICIGLIFIQFIFPFLTASFDLKTYFSLSFLETWINAALIGLVLSMATAFYITFIIFHISSSHSLKGYSPGVTVNRFRRGFTILQFGISLAVVTVASVTLDQMNFIKNRNPGFNHNQIISISIHDDEERNKIETLKNLFRQNPNIINLAATSGLTGGSDIQFKQRALGPSGELDIQMRIGFIDFNYIETMEMQLAYGRSFSPDFSTDSIEAVVINETALKEIGWSDPIGQKFKRGNTWMNVVGVIRDFNVYSVHRKIEPFYARYAPDRFNYLMIRLKPNEIDETLTFIQKTWRNIHPNKPMEFNFLDQNMRQLYLSDQKFSLTLLIFSELAIIIACIGLFGLTSLSIDQRTKEIGIRKVVGAKTFDIVVLFLRQFVVGISFAFLIAIIAAYYAGQYWLQRFSYHIELSIATFLWPVVFIGLAGILTVFLKTIRIAISNPVETLRYE